MRKTIIAGNWKMNTNRDEARKLATAVVEGVKDDRVTVVLCPPFPYLSLVADIVAGSGGRVALGAQNCSDEAKGAFTGEVSVGMLADVGCRYVIIGHSERRHGLGESDAFLNRKTKIALKQGLNVIFCVGETAAERDAGQLEAILTRQLTQGLVDLEPATLANLIIAYEPVWAIGTGRTAKPEEAQHAHALIRAQIGRQFGEKVASATPILYGGSVDREKIKALAVPPDIDGGLIGGASLKADEFVTIINLAQR